MSEESGWRHPEPIEMIFSDEIETGSHLEPDRRSSQTVLSIGLEPLLEDPDLAGDKRYRVGMRPAPHMIRV